MINPMDLTGKRILITGASAGIGRQTAITASQLGAECVLIARREEQLKETLAMMEGSNHSYRVFNLKQIDDIEVLIKELAREGGAFDGFVHCAGISINMPISLYKYEKLHNTMLTNFYAFYEIVRCISKKGNFNKGLSIVGLSSVASINGDAAHSAYAASKGAVDSTMRSMAKELYKKEIRVNTVMPAMVNTKMYQEYIDASDPADVENVLKRQYFGIVEPVNVAYTISFLLSSASHYITGISLPIDSGYTSS